MKIMLETKHLGIWAASGNYFSDQMGNWAEFAQ
jgi:hypothetical protein